MSLLIALAAAAITPQAGVLKTFKDWTVGCDNGRACQAVALQPEGNYDSVTMAVKRGPGPTALPEIWITTESRTVAALSADGKRLPIRLNAMARSVQVQRADAMALAGAISNAQKLALIDANGTEIEQISAAGASAALRYIDDQQFRARTVTAMIARGSEPASRVSPPPARHVIMQPPPSALPPAKFRKAETARYAGVNDCHNDSTVFVPEAHRIDATHTLVLVPSICGNGAYNYYATALIASNAGTPLIKAKFDAPSGIGEPDPADPALVNADWDPATRRLSTFTKGRGVGDCGTIQSFAWDGSRFRLAEQSEMSECRGSTDYITTWRATVR